MSTFQIQVCGVESRNLIVDDGGESLAVGSTWSFSSETGHFVCGYVIGESTEDPIYTAMTNYNNCDECLTEVTPPLSAGTEYEECLVCYSLSGNTVTSVSVPHPVWTNEQGQAVVQLGAVQLGGMNGLNS